MLTMRNIGSDYMAGAKADENDYMNMDKKQLTSAVRQYPMRFLPPTNSQVNKETDSQTDGDG